jgi:membrane-associated phospholipid phosphatase
MNKQADVIVGRMLAITSACLFILIFFNPTDAGAREPPLHSFQGSHIVH